MITGSECPSCTLTANWLFSNSFFARTDQACTHIILLLCLCYPLSQSPFSIRCRDLQDSNNFSSLMSELCCIIPQLYWTLLISSSSSLPASLWSSSLSLFLWRSSHGCFSYVVASDQSISNNFITGMFSSSRFGKYVYYLLSVASKLFKIFLRQVV